MANGKSLLLGFMVGGAVSAAATLISTPSSGKDFRSRAKEQSGEWKEMLDNLKLDGLRLKKQITETSREGAALVKELTQEMKNSVEEWKSTVEPHQESIHKNLEQIESSLRDLESKMKKESE
ncbi:YtxH domain-containing protein [Virgibacillus doumboii]|uniref:YtxH domain-containing protein n=1 Tax=Virgibacillus doumboii TaxID=2697503 RepID=UPI0013DFB8DE|nr:YtxH domain-containing protein [Virgibacillus doumboii]